MSVVEFTRPQHQVWVCLCGCSSFALRSDGGTECQNCGEQDNDGGWHIPKGGQWEGDEPVADIQGNGSVEFAMARVKRLAADDDVALVAIAKEDGRLHLWGGAETPEQEEWVKQKLIELCELWKVKT
ncbi:hypothetical protein [uncultured Roseobacter sp.]|uniref:hypothetical protein n=1 Tax=uncultured Roseobacter sp. TaxID=114847 RepID=UPI00261AA83C|nr:hypothetical protein [uncultured Roseobacter sp.]